MQLLNLKMNVHLIQDSLFLEKLGVKDCLENDVVFDSIYEEVQELCEQEEAIAAAQAPDCGTNTEVVDVSAPEGEIDSTTEIVDLF